MTNLRSQVLRYSLIGVGNTGAHLFIVWILSGLLETSQMFSNGFAYIIVSTISFVLNAKWSFQQAPGLASFRRFQIVSIFGLIVSSCIGWVGDLFEWHFTVTVMFIAIAVPILSFTLHRLYTFSR